MPGLQTPFPDYVGTLAIALGSNGLGSAGVRPKLARKPIPAKSRVIDSTATVRSFLAEMAEVTDYDFMPFRAWHASYRAMAKENNWPALSEKSLSLTMQVLGCERRQLDFRARGKGRPIAYRYPESLLEAA